ncbi:MAG: extracellular solute-binding protein [Phycisphaerae bacterium]|nr:extracellular solute-binding protein [Phycisphaerae bacterium]
MNIRLLIAILPAVLIFAGVGCNRSAAPDQPRVVVYCSADQNIAEPILAAFEAETGIKVVARFDDEATKTLGLVQRLRAQAKQPVADVFWSSEVFYTIRLGREGLLATCDLPKQPDVPQQYFDKQGRWRAFGLRARVIAYHTDRVTGKNIPRKLEDLLTPQWRGRIVMAQPQFGTTAGDVASWFAHYGPQRAKEILRALKANKVRLVGGNSTAVRMVATGRADVALTDTDDVYAAQRNGWPIAMTYLDQNGKGTLTIPNTVSLVAGGPNPATARKLMAFLLSEKAERLLAESDSHNTPVQPGLAKQFPAYTIDRQLDISYEAIADALPAAITAAGEILR